MASVAATVGLCPYTPPPLKTKIYGKEKNDDAEVKKRSQLSCIPATCLPRSLSFCPYPYKIFIHKGFLDILLSNPFIIRLWKPFPTNQKLPSPPLSLVINDPVIYPLIILRYNWRRPWRFASWELGRVIRSKRSEHLRMEIRVD